VKAVAIRRFGGPDVLELMELDPPELGAEDVLIETRASGVGPWDTKLRAGLVGTDYTLPWVIGSECAGVVERVGEEVTGLGPGDEVFSYAHIRGTYAERVAAPAAWTALKPESLGFEQAAALPLAGTTAHQAVTEDLAVKPAETLLVTGASGGVGGFAVQIAAASGVHVLATARAESHEFLRSLGAAEVFVSPREVGTRADALLDCVGGELLTQALETLREGGRAVTLLPPAADDARVEFAWGRPDGGRLDELARLVEDGKLRVELEQVLPIEQAALAHELIEAGGRRGKLVLQIA
jgi:NADPH:quinone reductase-like Zn-dependent oxidoreductase